MAEPVEVPEFLEPVTQYFTRILGEEKFALLISFLPSVGGILAGGSVLRAIHNEPTADIDIYVPTDKFIETYTFIMNDLFDPPPAIRTHSRAFLTGHKASLYCRSFLRRNKIRSVYSIQGLIGNRTFHFDIMAVRKEKTPEQVAQNFDLTFCQVWFDGNRVKATHPEDVRTKTGHLQGDYVKLFLSGNKFLHNRMRKYSQRGFKIRLEKLEEYQSTYFKFDDNVCAKLDKDSPEFIRNWQTAVMLFESLYLNVLTNADPNSLYPRLARDNDLGGRFKQVEKIGYVQKTFRDIFTQKFVHPTDGYDTDEYLEKKEDLHQLAKKTVESVKSSYGDISGNVEMKGILEEYLGNTEQFDYSPIGAFTQFGMRRINELLYFSDGQLHQSSVRKIKKYAYLLQDFLKNPGTDSITYNDESPVYNFHNHTDEQAISQESLEQYLSGFIQTPKGEDTTFPCYLNTKIDPNVCKHSFTMGNIRAIVSDEFWKRFDKGTDVLDTGAIAMSDEQILKNFASTTNEWGNIYHETICPYCLKDESRSEGCIYMTHDNPKQMAVSESPYCSEQIVVDELLEKYKNIARNHYGHDRFTLEFCVECGRPCVNHAHFDLSGGIFFPRNPRHGKCPGGGRKEMIARILAIRKVLREGNFNENNENDENDNAEKKKRRACALAAEAAAKDPAMLARGQAILDSNPDPAQRKWNNLGEQSDSKEEEEEGNNENNSNNNSNNSNNNNVNELPIEGEENAPAAAQPQEPAPAAPQEPAPAAPPPQEPAAQPQEPAAAAPQQGVENIVNMLRGRLQQPRQDGGKLYKKTFKKPAKHRKAQKTRSQSTSSK